MLHLASFSNRQNTRLSLALLTLVVLALHALVLIQGKGGLMVQGQGNAAVFSVRMLPAGASTASAPEEELPAENTPPDLTTTTPVAPGMAAAQNQTRSTPSGQPGGSGPSGAGSTGTSEGGVSAENMNHSVPLAEGFDLDNRPIDTGRAQGNIDAAVRIPPAALLKYTVQGQSGGSPIAETAELSWRHDGKSYDARLSVSRPRSASRVQTSRGLLGLQGLEPVRYGDKTGSELATHFQRDKNKVTFSANSPEAALHEGMQDPLSALIQLAALWTGAPGSYPQGSAIAIDTAGTRSVEPWVFLVGTMETLPLPGGMAQAIKVVREPVGPYGSRSEVWLAPALSHLPVRIRTTQANGNVSDLLWAETRAP